MSHAPFVPRWRVPAAVGVILGAILTAGLLAYILVGEPCVHFRYCCKFVRLLGRYALCGLEHAFRTAHVDICVWGREQYGVRQAVLRYVHFFCGLQESNRRLRRTGAELRTEKNRLDVLLVRLLLP